MSSKEWHTVNGTLFGFPELPPREEVHPEHYAKVTAERAAILAKAAAVRFKPAPRPRARKPPKAGDGEFSPKTGAPGSRVAVTVRVTDRNGRTPVKVAEVEREGCVMFPGPGGAAWVSLWDGQMPVSAYVSADGAATVHLGVTEYEERFGPLSAEQAAWAVDRR